MNFVIYFFEDKVDKYNLNNMTDIKIESDVKK